MGANAQTTVPTFTAAQVLTADQMNQSARTGVPVFADTTARDAGFGGSGEKTLAEGQLCYLESTNVVQYYDGAAWATVGPATAGALVFISSTSIGTGVASVAVTSVFSSTYDSYFVDVSGAAGNGNVVGLQIGAAATGYYGGGISVSVAGTVTGRGNNNAASFTNILPETDSQGFGLQIQIINPNLAKRTAIVATASPGGLGSYFAGALADATAYTGFTLTTTGTLTGGAIRVYGIAKS
jgi:hypothetical protein